MSSQSMHNRASRYFQDLQNRIVSALEELDGRTRSHQESWQREGGGRARVLADGGVIEKGGGTFSDVHGQISEEVAPQIPGAGREFTACGISLVLHPRNPIVPTVHANFHFLSKGEQQWFYR